MKTEIEWAIHEIEELIEDSEGCKCIGSLLKARALLLKQIPLKPVGTNGDTHCPVCGEICNYDTIYTYPYCPECGQRIDNEEVNNAD